MEQLSVPHMYGELLALDICSGADRKIILRSISLTLCILMPETSYLDFPGNILA